MSQSKTTILGVMAAILIIGGVWWGMKLKDKPGPVAETQPTASLTDEENKPEPADEPGFLSRIFGSDTSTYRDVSSKFLFEYPKGYSIKEMPAPTEGEARTLLLSKEGKAPSVQVAVSPFDEDIVLTVERIQADVPDLGMKNPQAVSVGSVTKGVRFDSDTGVNVWFVAKGNLFQLTAFSAEATVLDQIVSSFKM